MPCPACGNPTIRLSRKFKAPRTADARQWAKVEALVRRGFRFDTLYDGAGPMRYPATERGIAAFVERVARATAAEKVKGTTSKRRRKDVRRKQQARRART